MKIALLKYGDGMKIHFRLKDHSTINYLEYSVHDPLWEGELRELYSGEANEDLEWFLSNRKGWGEISDYAIISGENIEEMILELKEAILLGEII